MPDLDTVDVEELYDQGVVLVKSGKFVNPFVIKPAGDGSSLFRVSLDPQTPEALSGRFTTRDTAVRLVTSYVKQHKGTPAARGEHFAKLREEQNGKLRSKKDDHVRPRVGDGS
jgi:hypothetical protein